MKQVWEKQGLIYSDRAQIPTIWEKDSKTWRIFFADRTQNNKSFIRSIDVQAGSPKKVLAESKSPLLDFGPIGAFDHDGTMPSWITVENGLIYLYYIGWSVRQDVPYQNLIGLAVSKDGGRNFTKVSEGPHLSTSPSEPYFCSTPCVIKRATCDHLFYLSCVGWETNPNSPPEARYVIKHRERGADSNHWSQNPELTLHFYHLREGGLCRPSVLVDNNNNWHMWYCYRDLEGYRNNKQNSYRIGYAQPNVDIRSQWKRKDFECILEPSEIGWDSEAVSYPYVIKHQDQLFMFYNGNGFGSTGMGYATLPLSNL